MAIEWGAIATDTTNMLSLAAIILCIVLLVGGLTGFIVWYTRFKYWIVERKITRNGKTIRVRRARAITVNGAHYWQIFPRRRITSPPPESIHHDFKGRLFAECNITEEHPEPVWLTDTGLQSGALEPITTQERALHVQMMNEAVMRKKKSLIEYLMQLAPIFGMIIIIALILVFWAEIAAPVIEIQNMHTANIQEYKAINEDLQQITSNLARIMGEKDVIIEQTIPPDAEAPG